MAWSDYNGRRFQYWAPWNVTDWWCPWLRRGGDEYGNPSVYFNVPPLGVIVVFYSRDFQRERLLCDVCDVPVDGEVVGDEIRCVHCGTFLTLTDEAIAAELREP